MSPTLKISSEEQEFYFGERDTGTLQCCSFRVSRFNRKTFGKLEIVFDSKLHCVFLKLPKR